MSSASTITTMLSYDFVLRAFAASGIVALVAGAVGWFLVVRGQTFAGHALSHVGFAGATGAALVGAPPLAGMLVFTLLAGAAMGLLAERISGRDVAIGIVLALALGFGLLFISLNRSTTLQATSILFGNVLAVSPEMLVILAILGVAALAALAFLSRPLLFATLQPELAELLGQVMTVAARHRTLVDPALAEDRRVAVAVTRPAGVSMRISGTSPGLSSMPVSSSTLASAMTPWPHMVL